MQDDSPADRALELADEAGADPSAVDPETVRELLDADSSRARAYALEALRTAASAGAVDPEPFVPSLVDELPAEDSRVRNGAALLLSDVASRTPAAVTEAIEPMAALLSDEQPIVRTAATDFFFQVARASASPDTGVSPDVLQPGVPALRSLVVDGDGTQRSTAVRALGTVADAYGEELAPAVESFCEIFVERKDRGQGVEMPAVQNPDERDRIRDSLDDAKVRDRTVRSAAGEVVVAVARHDPETVAGSLPSLAGRIDDPNPAVRRIAIETVEVVGHERPDAVEPYLEDVAARLDDSDGVRGRAALALAAVSQADPDAVVDAVEPHVDAVQDLLDHEAPAVRGSAAGLLSYLAEAVPGRVDPAPVRSLLDDDHPFVRGHAVRVLAELGDDPSTDRLRELAETDPDENVRAAAEAALDAS